MHQKEVRTEWLKKTRITYFFTTMAVYIGLFAGCYALLAFVLRILQAHPYFYLLGAIVLLILDILATDRIINRHLAKRWVHEKPIETRE